MASDRQFVANRRNAARSTGPRTRQGKHRARANALRHGLTAETVVTPIEHQEEFETFDQAIRRDYCPTTQVEVELVSRLVSLLWRLRRATLIETDLMKLQERLRRRAADRANRPDPRLEIFHRMLQPTASALLPSAPNNDVTHDVTAPGDQQDQRPRSALATVFLRLCNLEALPLERLSRYEAALWRQTAQIVLLLEPVRLKTATSVNRDP